MLWVDKSRGLKLVVYCCFTDEPGRRDEGKTGEGSNETDLGSPDTGPKQIKDIQFPSKHFGLQKRSFQRSWYDTFNWLEYSVSQNSAFCFCCRLFSKQQCRHNKDGLASTGYTNWKRALDSFRDHEKTSLHKASMVAWMSYKASKVHGDVAEQLQTASVAEISERREYLCRIVSVTAFLAKQGISFRGHSEMDDSSNQGNFLECMQLLQKFDPFLQRYKAPANTTYLSPSSQNELIGCCSTEVTAQIIQEVKESKMYAVMADEAKDGHTEQLAVCVRYVPPEGNIKESFLCLKKLDGYGAEAITNAVEQVLVSNNIADLKVVAQTYDGAAVMSGSVRGVQARFREKHPEAVYVHCYAHDLNLVLCHTCKAIPEASDFFDLLENLYSFFSVSIVNHDQFAAIQRELHIEQGELVQISNTRWSCQLRSVNALLKNFPAVMKSLQTIKTPTAVGLHSKLSKLPVVYLLVVFKKLLGITEGFHKVLQKETVDLAQAVHYKSAVHDTLVSQRTAQVAEDIYAMTKTTCEENNIQEPSLGPRRKQKRMEDFVVEVSCGSSSDLLNDSEHLKQRLFYPCIDRMTNELENRFSSVGREVMIGIQACHPASETFLCMQSLEKLASHYNIQLVPEEVLVAKSFLSRKGPEAIPDILSVFKLLDPMMFPSLKVILQVALTIPVSSCSCERSFSALRRLHTWLRRTMGQERLNDLAVLSIERELVGGLDDDKVIDTFAQLKSRRHTLMLPHQKK